MSTIQATTDHVTPDIEKCPGCGANLPQGAVFCGSCGERLDKKKDLSSMLQDEQDIATHYRITSLVRRRPYVNLYLALDNRQPSHQGRMVAIRDISLSSLDEQARMKAIELVQQEYDLLRRWQLPYIMPAIDLRYFQGNVFVVAGFASPAQPADAAVDATGATGAAGTPDALDAEEKSDVYWPRLSTLQDFLQSGQGLPSEQRALQWMGCLCSAVDRLHRHQVVIGDLDPSTIILNGETDEAQIALMISWLLPSLKKMLPPPKSSIATLSYFIAPEAIQGDAYVHSDIYSLGAILYLLLTGMPPAESTLRHRTRLRTPQEVNARISLHVSECVMQALAIEPAERFQNVAAFAEALRNPRYRRPPTRREPGAAGEQIQDVETVRIVPLSRKDAERWDAARSQLQKDMPDRVPARSAAQPAQPAQLPQQPALLPEEIVAVQSDWQQAPASGPQPAPGPAVPVTPVVPAIPSTPPVDANAPSIPLVQPAEEAQAEEQAKRQPVRTRFSASSWEPPVTPVPQSAPARRPQPAPAARPWKQSITGMFKLRRSQQAASQVQPPVVGARFIAPTGYAQASWIDQLKHMVLGEQQHVIAAAAIVETPLRVQPDQMYTIRLQVMGRDEPLSVSNKGHQPGGLSALVHGDAVLIEVRSVLHQSYAYIVQQANVTIPAEGYAAEVVIPMQPLANVPTGRRDRLHIFFLDGNRHPLYERPFVVEVFVSPHVKRGNEGHHVLTIPV